MGKVRVAERGAERQGTGKAGERPSGPGDRETQTLAQRTARSKVQGGPHLGSTRCSMCCEEKRTMRSCSGSTSTGACSQGPGRCRQAGRCVCGGGGEGGLCGGAGLCAVLKDRVCPAFQWPCRQAGSPPGVQLLGLIDSSPVLAGPSIRCRSWLPYRAPLERGRAAARRRPLASSSGSGTCSRGGSGQRLHWARQRFLGPPVQHHAHSGTHSQLTHHR